MTSRNLQAPSDVTSQAILPAYDRDNHGVGIVHLGLGAFHKAHQAFYTDSALAHSGGDWRIVGVSLRDTQIPQQLNRQNGLYTLIENSGEQTHARIIGSIASALSAAGNAAAVMQILVKETTRIVSITVTEKGYGIDRATNAADLDNPVVKADLENPQQPRGVLGFLTEALRQRRDAGIKPFTVLCCDNLPDNGHVVKLGVIDFAQRVDTGLSEWIDQHVAFPSCMVDRITPAATPETTALAESMTGASDLAAIETEPFHQWVIEDNFPLGRPEWEAAGAIFTQDILPYDKMKLSMLNGAHSMLAYGGYLLGHQYVRDVMEDASMVTLIRRHLRAAAATLPAIPGIDFDQYANDLLDRFSNPSVAHETYQIAMDGSQKMPQRIFQPAVQACQSSQSLQPFAWATALWLRYCLGETDDGRQYKLRDPLEAEIAERLASIDSRKSESANNIVRSLLSVPGLVPVELDDCKSWQPAVTTCLENILATGVRQAVDNEAGFCQ